jgi:hypothetical protein
MKKMHVAGLSKFRRIGFERGTSLLESLAYLGIAALIILGAIALLTGAFSSSNSNTAEQQISAIRSGVKKLYAGQPSGYGTGSQLATLVPAKVFPASLTIGGTTAAPTVTNTFGGAVDVIGASSSFQVSYAGVPRDVCVNLVAVNSDWTSVQVNGGTALSTPVTPTAATSACSVTSSSGNTIVLTGS